MSNKLYNFGSVFLLAVLVGFLYILPPFLVWKDLHNLGEPFVLAQLETYKDEIRDYLPRAREAYDGHIPPKDAYFDEQRPTTLNPLPSILFSPFILLFKGDINLAYLGAQFFFSALIFLLFYFLGGCFLNSKLWRIFFAFTGTLTPLASLFYRWGLDGGILASIKEIIIVTIKQFIPIVQTQTHKMYLARIDDPLLTYPFFLLAMLFFFKFWFKPSKKLAFWAGIFAGSLFYVYFHYWVIWVVTVFILFLYSLYFRKENLERIKNFFILIGAWVVMSVPYFINYFKVSSFPNHNDFVYRFGIAVGRSWDVFWQLRSRYVVYILFAILVFFIYRKNNRDKLVLFLGCSLAMIISPNLQLITGFMPVPGQSTKASALFLFIMFFIVLHDLFKIIQARMGLFKIYFNLIPIILMVMLPLKKIINIISIVNPSSDIITMYDFPANTLSSWQWVDDFLPKESKIISSSAITSAYLSTYTSARPFVAVGFASAMPMKNLEDNFLTANSFFNVDSLVLRKRLSQEEIECFPVCSKDSWTNLNKSNRFLYINYFSSGQAVLNNGEMSQGYLDDLVKKYIEIDNETYKDDDFKYVYVGPWEKQFSQPKFADNKDLSLVFLNSSVEIYEKK